MANFVVKGYNSAYNYYLDPHFVVDLESGVPILQNTSRCASIDFVNYDMLRGSYQIDQIVEITH